MKTSGDKTVISGLFDSCIFINSTTYGLDVHMPVKRGNGLLPV